MIDLSIIIVSWNTRELLLPCLHSVFESTHGLVIEVLVIDNASTDDSAAMVRKAFPQVKLIENSGNVGFATASNQGIHESVGQYTLLLNSDTVVREKALEELFSFMQSRPQAAVAGSKLVDQLGSVESHDPCFPTLFSEFCVMTHLDRLLLHKRNLRHKPDCRRPVDWLTGACILVRRQAIEEVGLLDESFFMYAEEMDWCQRFWQAGWETWYVPESEVLHYGGGSSKLVADQMFLQLYKSRIHFFRKHRGTWSARALKVVLALGSVLRLAASPPVYAVKPSSRVQVKHKFKCYGRLLLGVYAL